MFRSTGKAWLEVTQDPHGANVEQVKPLFAAHETVIKGVKRKAYNIRIATLQIRKWGAEVLS